MAVTRRPPRKRKSSIRSRARISPRTFSESPAYATEEEDDEEGKNIDLGPQYTIKQQFEKDKDDESLRRWKEQLLGSVDFNSVGESLDPEVKILSLTIKSPGSHDVLLFVPENGKPNGPWFTLKEGSRYSLNFSFQEKNNIVAGLKYTKAVWKAGVKVDSTKEMIGTFSSQLEPYTHEMHEDTTPSGFFGNRIIFGTNQGLKGQGDASRLKYLGFSTHLDLLE